ncbi:amidohydrolase family protein [Thermofilum pendens]|uniref:Amidohydrolase n=1 Tax=Thermofilum pendens (strain DSM 2475 / Hrk 5) TaxID=368408 RepID=A1RW89_THEPD|nr:amidohydrolase family protein [Thermofilum pendens]ABL77469.1 amidohydrolase [Thermofilum pendens Hrk 5]
MATLVIRDADTILTMNSARPVLRHQSILVDGNVVAAVGDYSSLVASYGAPDEVIDGRGKVVLPGFYDLHTHIAMAGFRGLAADAGDVIYRVFWPLERLLSGESVYRFALLGGLEALKSGVVLVADHYFFMRDVARALVELGLRGLLGHTYMDRDGPFTGERELREALDFVERWRGHELITPVLAPHAPDTVSRDNLLYFAELSREKNLFVHMHLAQTLREFKTVKEETGYTPVRYALRLGLLGGRSIVAHANYVDENEKALLAHSGSVIVQCPSTYFMSGTPFHAYDYWQLGGNVAIGTDAPCYNDNVDFFEEMRLLVYGQRMKLEKSGVWRAYDVLEMATRLSARLVGVRGGFVGKGALADLVLVNLSSVRLRPFLDPFSNIVYAASSGDVDTVIVNGRVVLKGGRHVSLDEERIVSQAEAEARMLLRRALDESPELESIIGRDKEI